ncbi:hypothetical protein QTI91_15215, partial [Clostridium perfringens]|nr:hypothetical protein [Clostridium perfringens]
SDFMDICTSLWVSDKEMEQMINDSFFDSIEFMGANDDVIGGYLYCVKYKDGHSEYVNCDSRFFV